MTGDMYGRLRVKMATFEFRHNKLNTKRSTEQVQIILYFYKFEQKRNAYHMHSPGEIYPNVTVLIFLENRLRSHLLWSKLYYFVS